MAHEGWGAGWSKTTPPTAPPRARAKRQESEHRKRNRRRAWIGAGITAGAVVVTTAGLGAWVAYDALGARASLEEAAAAIPQLEQRLRTSPDEAQQDLEALQTNTADAARRTSGPLWALAGKAPVLGDDIRALAKIAETVDMLAVDVLPRMSAAAQAVTPERLAPQDGRVNLAAIQEVRADVVAADLAVGSAVERLSAVPREGLIAQLADAADEVQDQLAQVRLTTATAARAVELLPPMLGADGPREWLVLAQNNAQQRATGGIPGAVLLVHADDGELGFVDKASTADISVFDAPVLPLTDTEEALFGAGLGRWVQNINFTPHFPRTAELASEMWVQRMGGNPRGVLSIDPVALQSLVGATGPVTFEDPFGVPITLTEQTTAEFLMSTIYANYTVPSDQDEVFALAAEAVFAALTTGDVDAGRAIDALVGAADEGRLMVWSADNAEQALLAGTVLSGELRGSLPSLDGYTSPKVGAFLNMTTSGKLGFYLETSHEVEDVRLRPDGSQEFTLLLRLTNVLAPGAEADLPPYVTGNTPGEGTIRNNLLVYAPTNGAITGVTDAAGEQVSVLTQIHGDLPVVARTVAVAPGETEELQFRIVSGREQRGDIHVRTTPGPAAS
ncbi:hypothetical protein Xcel_2908 [Xylanimonas cellulosilytica DSM 15894]|uniref:DUF4012 domain-containing protein n=1 Tax=Xylanimonas cellulosilytica (strain DSM 15894 / JCM 12276 / CECT 5975 / KCTC 9989 / LMG 20990 / NBRC 107835 / XIL07) TaxID=446471 RepID=D1BZ19_XYLCX|nr:DUF4012 domain-containing protein [Xylanimonas cellulosilytica]ACZ31916.1 hypothetical protein Xcel_2908 [Xylanimonas cellulosilytica DSM 15894]